MKDMMSVDAGNDSESKGSVLMEIDKETAVLDSPCLFYDAPSRGVAAPTSLCSSDAKESSSYGKSNFVLPVTFFDIPSNLSYLNECCPLTIKVVDCDKHPWYYKQYLRSDLQCASIEENNSNTDLISEAKANSMDCINIDLTDNMYDKYENINYTPNQSISNKERLKINKSDHGNEDKGAGTQKGRYDQDKIKKMALSQIDPSKIDFKKNKGLIGLKIIRKNEVLENMPDDSDKVDVLSIKDNNELIKPIPKNTSQGSPPIIVNSDCVRDKHNEPIKPNDKRSHENPLRINNELDKYMSGVNKILCEIGTSVIPLNVNPDVKKDLSCQSNMKSNMNKSDIIIEMSKKKLRKRRKNESTLKQHLVKTNVPTRPTIVVTNKKNEIHTDNSSLPVVQENAAKKSLKIAMTKKISSDSCKPSTRHAQPKFKNAKNNKRLTKIQSAKPIIQQKECKEVSKMVKDLFRSRSPIFSCNVNKSNKLLPLNENSKVHEVVNNESNMRNFNLDKQHSPVRSTKHCVKDQLVKPNVSLAHNDSIEVKSDTKCIKDHNKFIITPVSIDKLIYDDVTQVQNNMHTKDLLKSAHEQNHQHMPYSQSEQSSSTGKVHNNANKNTNEKCNIFCPAQAIITVTSTAPFHNSQKLAYQQSQVNISQNVKAKVFPEPIAVIETTNQFKHHIGQRVPVRIQVPQVQKFKKDFSRNIPRFIAPHARFSSPRSANPYLQTRPFYDMNHFPRNSAPYPFFDQQHYSQQNPSVRPNIAPQNMGNPNPYWPCWFSPHLPPPPVPPPPPPLSEKYDLPLEKVASHSISVNSQPAVGKNKDNIVKRINILRHIPNNINSTIVPDSKLSHIIDSAHNLPEKELKPHVASIDKLVSHEALSNAKPVNSKSEMFHELQKESMRINDDVLKDDKGNEVYNTPAHHSQVPNTTTVSISSQGVCTNAGDKRLHPEVKTRKSPPTFMPNSKMLHSKWKEEQKNKTKKDDALDWKIRKDEVVNPNYSNCKSRDSTFNDNNSLPDANKVQLNRPKAGPLCMKNKSGPFAKNQTPSPNRKSPPKTGYSPPILPIPTFQKSLEMLTQANDMQRQIDKKNKCRKRSLKYQPNENPMTDSREPRKRNLAYFYMDKDEKSLKKITLQDYQNRVAYGDGKCIVLTKDNSGKRSKQNQSSEQDLGYDSDATVKL